VNLAEYRRAEREKSARGADPLRVLVAYAQDHLVYRDNRIVPSENAQAYRAEPADSRVNKFHLAYRADAPFLLYRPLADIMVDMAVDLYLRHGWNTLLMDGLRTVEGHFILWRQSEPSWLEAGLLARPGQSAHNKGCAIDSMMFDAKTDQEIDMGGHFDHSDMQTNHRLYDGTAISQTAKENRLLREQATQRAALKHGLLIAPLRPEFWDDRFPESREDLWRVLESVARCIGVQLLSPEDDALMKRDRKAFAEKWERWSYADFCAAWQRVFAGRQQQLVQTVGTATPPASEEHVVYHGAFNPLYDRDLKVHNKHLADETVFRRYTGS
jgi:D-alanyl-D-alanine dipeptidase